MALPTHPPHPARSPHLQAAANQHRGPPPGLLCSPSLPVCPPPPPGRGGQRRDPPGDLV